MPATIPSAFALGRQSAHIYHLNFTLIQNLAHTNLISLIEASVDPGYWDDCTSSSTFCPHPGRVIRDLSRQLYAVRH